MTYKKLYEKLKEFALDSVYQNDEVDVSLYATFGESFVVQDVTEDGYIIIVRKE